MGELHETVLQELRRAQLYMIGSRGSPFETQFRIDTPDGAWWINIALSDYAGARSYQLKLISRFMASKRARGFAQTFEIADANLLVCAGVKPSERLCVASKITRRPFSFGPEEWLARDLFDIDMPQVPSDESSNVSAAETAELGMYFGAQGKFPARRAPTNLPRF